MRKCQNHASRSEKKKKLVLGHCAMKDKRYQDDKFMSDITHEEKQEERSFNSGHGERQKKISLDIDNIDSSNV